MAKNVLAICVLLSAQKALANQVTQVSAGAGSVRITADEPPNFTTFTIDYPPRLVVDVAGASLVDVPTNIQVGQAGVTGIQTLPYGAGSSAVARIIIMYDKPVQTDIMTDGNSIVIRQAETPATVAAAQRRLRRPPPAPQPAAPAPQPVQQAAAVPPPPTPAAAPAPPAPAAPAPPLTAARGQGAGARPRLPHRNRRGTRSAPLPNSRFNPLRLPRPPSQTINRPTPRNRSRLRPHSPPRYRRRASRPRPKPQFWHEPRRPSDSTLKPTWPRRLRRLRPRKRLK